MIDLFKEKLDVVGFTTYPFMEYNKVAEIPEDYYSEITKHTDKPVVFTEMGWPSSLEYVESSEQAQVDFLLEFLEQTTSINMEFMIWSFLHDGTFEVEIFNTVALKKNDGEEKLVYEYWGALRSLG